MIGQVFTTLLIGDRVALAQEFRAGAAAVDVSPERLPVLVNGGFLQAEAKEVRDKLHARCLVLDDGATRLAIVVVDSCMMPRELIDRAKRKAHELTGLAIDRMLISATHTHSAPAAMGALGCAPDGAYVECLPGRIATSIAEAVKNLAPARVGWAVIDDYDHTHCRRWIRRPDRLITDPFGQASARANMHPGYLSPDVIGPSGPVDPGLSVLSVQGRDGRPIAVLANYSMHYFGAAPVSADYYGRFADAMARLVGARDGSPPFVAIMSQGTSGDQHWMDYGRAELKTPLDAYAEAVARVAYEAYSHAAYSDHPSLAMAERKLRLRRRVPDPARLAWARPLATQTADRPPRTLPEVYARETFFLHEQPERELKLQAIRIGKAGIAAIPDEVYALSGLKIKATSPLPATFTIELANGSEGYIPPPEQHALGGYTTWPARTAALEVQAEPKIVETVLGLLEEVSGRPRRRPVASRGAYARTVLDGKPVAYWRLEEMSGPTAHDATGHGHRASYESGIAFYLEGPRSSAFSGSGSTNRAAHFAGGRLTANLPRIDNVYTVEFWFWNGLPHDARDVTGYLLAHGSQASGLSLAIGGKSRNPGRLVFHGEGGGAGSSSLVGRTDLAVKTWHHVALVREGSEVVVYLNGERDLSGALAGTSPAHDERWYLAGRHDYESTFEGKLDEIAIYDRVLTPSEIRSHLEASRVDAGRRAD